MSRRSNLVGGILFTGVAVLAISSAKTASCAPNQTPPLEGFEFVDLTHALHENIPVYPGSGGFKLTNLVSIEDGYVTNRIAMDEHVGTHIDAPSHFIAGGKTLGEVSLKQLFGPLVVIDVREEAAADADLAIGIEHLRRHELKYGIIPPRAFVVANTGWFQHWERPKAYVNLGEDGRPHFPGFSGSAAAYLTNERHVAGMGIDTLSTDVGISEDFPQHRIFLRSGGVNIENLTNLNKVPARGAYLLIAPLRIRGGSGGAARVLAIVPQKPLSRPVQ